MVITLGRGAIVPILRQILIWPVLVLLLTIALAVYARDAGWFTVGGSINSAVGAKQNARRSDPPG
jgi:hypothetical protein